MSEHQGAPGDDRVDVAVVGGGLAGLVAAVTAAETGKRVVLLEAHGLGGRASTDAQHGFRFNRGPRALYSGHGRAVLERLGMRPAARPPSAARLRFAGASCTGSPLAPGRSSPRRCSAFGRRPASARSTHGWARRTSASSPA